jgi:MoaA/NifB/PqqE/SkfB family radical SAM enzyme
MLATLIFSTTYRCSIECKLCGLSCNPRRKEQLSLKFMEQMIEEYLKLGGGKHVTFTGGEPFLLGSDLLSAVESLVPIF